MHGARGGIERVRGTSTTRPSAARAARRAHAVVPWQAPTAAPEAWRRAGPPPRRGTPWWPHVEGETPQSLYMPRDTMPVRPAYCRLLAMASPHLDARRNLVI